MLDYGPVNNFWLFSFERFNGVLGDFKTNQRAVELQLLRKFLRDQDIRDLPFPNLYCKEFFPIFKQMNKTSMNPLQDISYTVDLLALADGPVTKLDLWLETKSCICFSPHKIDYLDDDELNYLMCCYSTFHLHLELSYLITMPVWSFVVIGMVLLIQEVSVHPT